MKTFTFLMIHFLSCVHNLRWKKRFCQDNFSPLCPSVNLRENVFFVRLFFIFFLRQSQLKYYLLHVWKKKSIAKSNAKKISLSLTIFLYLLLIFYFYFKLFFFLLSPQIINTGEKTIQIRLRIKWITRKINSSLAPQGLRRRQCKSDRRFHFIVDFLRDLH